MRTLTNQQGMSLVELMVAVTLSLILMAGVIQVHVSSKASYQVQHELSTLQQHQRMAVELLNRDIRKAGLSITKAVSAFPTNGAGWDGGGSAPDEITISYEAAKDCVGDNTDNTDGVATNRYFIQDGSLMCEGVNNNKTHIVDGVTNMQILYGEDTDPIVPGQVRTANRYVKPADAIMANVVSVRIALLFQTDDVVRGVDEGQAVDRDYFLLDAPKLTFSDQKRREAVTTTITLRNIG
jgi:type IV pilus assembly protein PilW